MFKDKNFKLLFWLSALFGFVILVALYVFNLAYMRGLTSKDGLQTAVFADSPIIDYFRAAGMGVAVSALCLGAMIYTFRRYLVLVVPVVLYYLLFFIWNSISNISQGFYAQGGIVLLSTLNMLTVITLPLAVYLLSKATKRAMPAQRYFLTGIISILAVRLVNSVFSAVIMIMLYYQLDQTVSMGGFFSYFFHQVSIYSVIIQCIGFILAFFFLRKRFFPPTSQQQPQSV